MTLLERIKATICGEDAMPRPMTGDEENSGYPSRTGYRQQVSTLADDPVMDEVAALGVQPVSKPAEIEQAQNPVRDRLHRAD